MENLTPNSRQSEQPEELELELRPNWKIRGKFDPAKVREAMRGIAALGPKYARRDSAETGEEEGRAG